jgi:hypothetical protein
VLPDGALVGVAADVVELAGADGVALAGAAEGDLVATGEVEPVAVVFVGAAVDAVASVVVAAAVGVASLLLEPPHAAPAASTARPASPSMKSRRMILSPRKF